MGELETVIPQHLLDLLVDGPSSFAALYKGLVQNWGYSTDLDVSEIMEVLQVMEAKGWVTAWQMAEDGSFHKPTDNDRRRDQEQYEAWLPEAAFEDLSLDEVGLWFEITADGRAEWERWGKGKDQNYSDRWIIEDKADLEILTIHATSVERAEEALRCWLSLNRDVILVEDSRCVEPVSTFQLRNDMVIYTGITLVYQYRRRCGRQ